MLDHEAAAVALRTRLRGVSIATTGSATLAATANGYSRLAGSFITDGLRVGMEFLPSGFATNVRHVITEVTALTVTTADTITAEVSAAGRTLLVDLPETRLWENTKPIRSGVQIEAPTSGRPYVSDEFIPATHEQVTFPASNGQAEETGQYVITYYGLSNTATAGIRAATQAIALLFTAGTTVTVGSNVLRIGIQRSGRPQGARIGQITPIANGWSYQQITVPWYCMSTNLVAA